MCVNICKSDYICEKYIYNKAFIFQVNSNGIELTFFRKDKIKCNWLAFFCDWETTLPRVGFRILAVFYQGELLLPS